MMIDDQIFISSIDLNKHPIKNTKQALKTKYYYTLMNYVRQCAKSDFVEKRLDLYRKFLVGSETEALDFKKCEESIVVCRFQPWRNKYKQWLVCDLVLICCDLSTCQQAIEKIKAITTRNQRKLIDDLVNYIIAKDSIQNSNAFDNCRGLIQQCWDNQYFKNAKEKRILITANMSAGKSTLINALVGKDLARTSQEVCTGNLCYYYNLPFEDGTTHFRGKTNNLMSSEDEYKTFEWDSTISIAKFFNSEMAHMKRVCLIDTPGVNSSIRREHGKISKQSILEEEYDYLVYILNANKLGTDEEIAYLKWIYKNVAEEKIIFVLNKLDDFKRVEDSIEMSIDGVKTDLRKIGYEKPIIYPISAYFAYLLRKEEIQGCLTEDELDEIQFFKKKFLKPDYNLSLFYSDKECEKDYEGFLKRSGVFYLEEKLYGGLQ